MKNNFNLFKIKIWDCRSLLHFKRLFFSALKVTKHNLFIASRQNGFISPTKIFCNWTSRNLKRKGEGGGISETFDENLKRELQVVLILLCLALAHVLIVLCQNYKYVSIFYNKILTMYQHFITKFLHRLQNCHIYL